MTTTSQMSREEADYKMLRLYSIDLDDVAHSLRTLSRFQENDVRWIILRELIVAYARPFSGNKDDLGKPHRLSARRMVPRELRGLHRELVAVRHELFAHTDYKRRTPEVAAWRQADGGYRFTMAFRAYDFPALDAKVPDIEKLVAAVTENVNAELRRHESAIVNSPSFLELMAK